MKFAPRGSKADTFPQTGEGRRLSEARYYRHSGRIGLLAPVWMAFAGVAAAVVVGLVYGHWMYYLFALFTVWVPPVYGAMVGLAVGFAAHAGKTRSGWFTSLGGVGAGVLAIYTGWLFWLWAWSGHDYFALFSGYSLWSAMGEAAAEGIWYFDEFELDGGTLYFWWVVEGLLILLGSWLGAWFAVQEGDNIFCEACGRWAETVWTSGDLANVGNEYEFRDAVEADAPARLMNLTPTTRAIPGTTSQIKVIACATCKDLHVLDVETIAHGRTDKGKDTASVETVVDNLLIDEALFEDLKARYPRPAD